MPSLLPDRNNKRSLIGTTLLELSHVVKHRPASVPSMEIRTRSLFGPGISLIQNLIVCDSSRDTVPSSYSTHWPFGLVS